MLGLLFFGWNGFTQPASQPFNPRYYWGSCFLFWVLFAILGWAQFGPLLHR
jgi:hypothetical protein